MTVKIITLLICNFLGIVLFFGQVSSKDEFSKKSKREVNVFISSFRSLYEKIPTYGTEFIPYMFTQDKSGKNEIRLIEEEILPNDLEHTRRNISKVFKQDTSILNLKIIAMVFKTEVEDPKNKNILNVIAVYIEHMNEKNGRVYYLPYRNIEGKVEFQEYLNFNKSAEKLVL